MEYPAELCVLSCESQAPKVPGTRDPDVVAFLESYVAQFQKEGAFRLWTGSPEWNGPYCKPTLYIAVSGRDPRPLSLPAAPLGGD